MGRLRIVLLGALVVAGCKKTAVKVDGSSTVYAITRTAADRYQAAGNPAPIELAFSGTGGGFRKFCAGKLDICDASRPINRVELDQCKGNAVDFVELSIAFDGIAVVVNAQNDWATSITTTELRLLWSPDAAKKITRWSQVRATWPDKEIHLYGPGQDSGTYDYFTAAIVGDEHSSRMDFKGSEDDAVIVNDVAGDELGLGYFGLAVYEGSKDRLKVLAVDAGHGAVVPSPDTVQKGSYKPLARPLFLYVSRSALDRPEVSSFVGYYVDHASELTSAAKYVPLSAPLYAATKERATSRVTGSVFYGGSSVNVTFDDLLAGETDGGHK